jgi:hyperosmotically inducible protein
MKNLFSIGLISLGLLGLPVVASASANTEHAKTVVKDSAITTKVKAKLAAEHITSLGRIHVETDRDGVVWLRGTAHTQEAADKAVEVARSTENVTSVHSDIKVKAAR